MRKIIVLSTIILLYTSCAHRSGHRAVDKTKPIDIESRIDQQNSSGGGASPLSNNDEERESLSTENLPVNNSDQHEQIIKRMTYIVSFNEHTHHPNWVAWTLTGETTDGPYKRKDLDIKGDYLEDETSLKGRQLLSDWRGTPGYDHGHMCPSGDNKWSLDAMRETFYLSNMCVQKSELNQGTWEHLESTCRSWAKKYGSIRIVCGPIFTTKPMRKIGYNENLFVPDAFFKVVLRTEGGSQALGFIYKNEVPQKGERLESHVVTVDEVESITGFDFFSDLPDEVENVIEAHADIKNWSKQ